MFAYNENKTPNTTKVFPLPSDDEERRAWNFIMFLACLLLFSCVLKMLFDIKFTFDYRLLSISTYFAEF